MAYISSTANRFYAAVESVCGVPPVPAAVNRLLGQQLQLTQRFHRSQRNDKSGFRNRATATLLSLKEMDFVIESRLTSWGASPLPNLDPVFQGAFGEAARSVFGLVIAGASQDGTVTTQQPHGLVVGDAFCCSGELRFVLAVPDARTVQANLPFSVVPVAGTVVKRSATYKLGPVLPSLSVFDYWTPTDLSRVAVGAFVNDLTLRMTSDGFDVQARGIAADLLQAGNEQIPLEPSPVRISANPISTQTGALFFGNAISEPVTVSALQFSLCNNLVVRPLQFGCSTIRDVAPGVRSALMSFSMYVTDVAIADTLCRAAQGQTPLPVFVQMGSPGGSSAALYLPAFVPDVPRFDDIQARLSWQVSGTVVQSGGSGSEVYLAFA